MNYVTHILAFCLSALENNIFDWVHVETWFRWQRKPNCYFFVVVCKNSEKATKKHKKCNRPCKSFPHQPATVITRHLPLLNKVLVIWVGWISIVSNFWIMFLPQILQSESFSFFAPSSKWSDSNEVKLFEPKAATAFLQSAFSST